ncbi:MAG: M28 family metallopeptidase [Gemmatimonadales bacterium]
MLLTRPAVLCFVAIAGVAGPSYAQSRGARTRGRANATVSADSLRRSLFAIADDSMGGRDTGSPGNAKTTDWVAAAFARYGLEPTGENGTWFQVIPFLRNAPDTASGLDVGGARLRVGHELLPVGVPMTWLASQVPVVYGGATDDSSTWPAAGIATGKLVVLRPRGDADVRQLLGAFTQLRRNAHFAGAAGFAVAGLESLAPDLVDQLLQGRITTDTTHLTINVGQLLVTRAAAETLLGAPLASATTGQAGQVVTGRAAFELYPLRFPVRNVVGVLRGSDPALRGTFVSISGHNDHVGFTRAPVDHDSTRAFNRIVRPMGADSRMRPATAQEQVRISALRDSLGRAHRPRADSIFNGADDDGSGTVALVELARVLAAGPRPRRSMLFVSHAAEERGLLGSRWFTDHPTLDRDSIVAEIDVDMIGRGDADDLAGGGPGYLEVVGAKRLSTEFGAMLDSLAARAEVPFHLNYEYDAPGHPLQYYCRADHFSYARYGIPSVSLSTGEHLDYHQVTDEPQYIDYAQLARVTSLVQELALSVANLDHRPLVDGPHGDPHAPCRQ